MDIWQGIETEYAVPLSADSDCANHVHEMIDALFRQGRRGQGYLLGTPKGVPLQFLRNGGKAYADHLPGHDIFEISTPECWGARQVVLYERASDALVRHACKCGFVWFANIIHWTEIALCTLGHLAHRPDKSYTINSLCCLIICLLYYGLINKRKLPVNISGVCLNPMETYDSALRIKAAGISLFPLMI